MMIEWLKQYLDSRVGSLVAGVLAAALVGGLCYLGWLAAFLLLSGPPGQIQPNLLVWLSAPLVTAAGFAAGMALVERLAGRVWRAYWRLLIWPVVGCTVGAAAVYPFGPMLIVFGIFVGGMASVALRAAFVQARERPNG